MTTPTPETVLALGLLYLLCGAGSLLAREIRDFVRRTFGKGN